MSFSLGRRYLVILVLVYLFATFLALKFPALLPENLRLFHIYSILFIALLFVALCILCIVNKEIRNMAIFSFFMIIFFIAALLRFSAFSANLEKSETLIKDNAVVSGVVKSPASLSSTQKTYSVNFDIYSVDSVPTKNIPIKLYIPTDLQEPHIGDTIDCTLSLNLVSPPAFENAFDYQKYLFQNGLVSAYYAKKAEFSGKKSVNPLLVLGLKLREAIISSISRCYYNPDNAELLKGILVGDVSGFSDELYNRYTNSGFIHIASVSGMHTSYILSLVAFVLCFLRFPKRFTAFVAIPILIVFAAIALFTASVLRAVIMSSVLLLSMVFKRHNDSITALFISALILVFYNPYMLTGTGFLLSYGATLGILVFFRKVRDCIGEVIYSTPVKSSFLHRLGCLLSGCFVNSVSLSLSATVGISYFTAKFFGKLQLGGIMGNLLIGILVAFVFFCGYANCILLLINEGLAQTFAFAIINPCLSVLNGIAEFFSNKIFQLNVMSPSDLFFAVYLVACAAFYLLLTPNEKNA